MKPIKIQVWDKQTKEMYDAYQIDTVNEMVSYHDKEKRYSSQGYDMPTILRQYTGVKDNNDKEIYDGDIIRFLDAYMHGESGDWDECECVGQIKWDDDLAQFYVTKRESMDNEDFWEQVNEFEVIGNIYENPELLDLAS